MSALRVNDRRINADGVRSRFTSRILPLTCVALRRSPRSSRCSICVASTGDFREALAALLGDVCLRAVRHEHCAAHQRLETEYRAFETEPRRLRLLHRR